MPVPHPPKSGQTNEERVIRLEQEIHRLKEKPDRTTGSSNNSATPSYIPWVAIIISCAALILALLCLLKSA